MFGRKFTCEGNLMEHGSQVDGHSCGIILGNTIEHAITATPIWEPQRAIIERLRWFRRFSKGIGHDDEDATSSNFSKATQQMLERNPELSISIALGDHNFPDLAQFALGSDSDSESDLIPEPPASGPQLHLSFTDILNPADDSEATEYPSSKLEGSVSPLTEDWGGLDGRANDDTNAYSTSSIEGAGLLLNAMDTDQSCRKASPQQETGGVTETSESSGGDCMDVDEAPRHTNSNTKPMKTKEQSSIRSFFQLKNGPNSDKEVQKDRVKTIPEATIEGESRHLKRRRVVSDTDSDSDESESYRKRKGKVGRSDGTSRSAKASRARREKLRQGELRVDQAELGRWKQKLLADDPNVEFHPSDVRSVRHSTCGKSILMKEVCDATRWRTHLKNCNGSGKKRKPSAGVPTLLRLGFESVKATMGSIIIEKKSVSTGLEGGDESKADTHNQETVPCPGIVEANNPRIPTYLHRTGVSGGGARSVKVIAGEIYNKLFSVLGKKAKQNVLDRQQHEHKWRNDHRHLRVFAVACKRTVPHNDPQPCSECTQVLSSKPFKDALRKSNPEEKNYIYTNHRFRNPLLGNIYARTIGLKELIEMPVSFWYLHFKFDSSEFFSTGCQAYSLYSLCARCINWKVRQ